MLRDFIRKMLGRGPGTDLNEWRMQYEAIFANMPVGVSFLTRDMRYIRINPYLEGRLGLKSAEIEGKFCYDVVGMYKDDANRKGPERICDVCGVRTAIETGRPFKFTRKVNPGFIVDNMGVPVFSDGRVVGAAEIIMDVTSRVGLEDRLQRYASDLEVAVEEKTRELRKSRSFLDSIIQSTGDAIFTLDKSSRIKFLNSAAGVVLGRSAASLLDRPLTDFTDGEGRLLVEDALEEAESRSQTVYNVRVGVDAEDGGKKALLMSFAPLSYQDGSSLFVCICKDITREAGLEAEREEFIAMLSHDLKTPLTSILGYSSLVLNGDLGSVGKEVEQSVRGVRTNANKMLGLVENFLSAGRMEEVDSPPVRGRINLSEKIRECIGSMKPLFDDKDLAVSTDIQDGLPEISADREQIERVVYNLVSNAIKFTPRGGSVMTRLYRADDGYMVFEVSDTGPGISGEEMPKVFDKYYRGVGDDGSGGTGLGLYITKSIVESHDGSIELKSGEGPGATFMVRLPLDN